MPSKQFMKGKNIINLYPTDKQLAQLRQKMADNGYKTLTKYLIDMGLKATVKTEIILDSTHKDNEYPADHIDCSGKVHYSTHKNNTVSETQKLKLNLEAQEKADKEFKNNTVNKEIDEVKYTEEKERRYQPKSTMVKTFTKGGGEK